MGTKIKIKVNEEYPESVFRNQIFGFNLWWSENAYDTFQSYTHNNIVKESDES